MKARWHERNRPVLVKAVADCDRGVTCVDEAVYAAALQMSPSQIGQSLRVLGESGLLESHQPSPGQWIIVRVCPLARQVLGAGTTGRQEVSGPSGGASARPGSAFDEIVLRATTGP